LDETDKKNTQTIIEDAIQWLDSNPNETKETYENKQKEVEDTITPILTKASQPSTGTNPSQSTPQGSESGIKIEEVD
jgi:L1 cell adhesion molecule like protein